MNQAKVYPVMGDLVMNGVTLPAVPTAIAIMAVLCVIWYYTTKDAVDIAAMWLSKRVADHFYPPSDESEESDD